jgi:hypothetical protein
MSVTDITAIRLTVCDCNDDECSAAKHCDRVKGRVKEESQMERQLRISGILIILGLIVEALSLFRIHPLSFLAFMFIGGGFLVAGIAVYLYSLVRFR